MKSPVFRDYQSRSSVVWAPSRLPGMGKQLYVFNLVRKANKGDAEAQNDLGLRYLLGDGFQADTAAAVEWIRKAARQKLYAAHYNLGVFHSHGIGVNWDPYKAYRHFRYAAENGNPRGQYALALMYTDNLVVERNWKTAYTYLKHASENGIDQAGKVVDELFAKGYLTAADTADIETEEVSLPPVMATEDDDDRTWTPVFLDLDRDTVARSVDIQELMVEAIETSPLDRDDSLAIADWVEGGDIPDSALLRLQHAANAGNPEATVFLGKASERGLLERSSLIVALQHYIHAVYLDSWHAGALINQSLQNLDIHGVLTRKGFENDPAAMFVWAGLKLLKIDQRLSESKALELLARAGERGNTFALIHLGICYANGIFTGPDRTKALAIWEEAARRGSVEAESRIAAESILHDRKKSYREEVRILERAREQGSLLAVVALAYAWQSGTGYKQNMANAVRLYRMAAIRGSRNAHAALQEIYRDARPENWDELAAEKGPPEVRR